MNCTLYCQPDEGIHAVVHYWTGPKEATLADHRKGLIGVTAMSGGKTCVPWGDKMMVVAVDRCEAPPDEGCPALLLTLLVVQSDPGPDYSRPTRFRTGSDLRTISQSDLKSIPIPPVRPEPDFQSDLRSISLGQSDLKSISMSDINQLSNTHPSCY